MHVWTYTWKQTGIIDLLPAPEELPPVEATSLDRSHAKSGRNANANNNNNNNTGNSNTAGNKGAAARSDSAQGGGQQRGGQLVTRVRSKDEKLLALAFKVLPCLRLSLSLSLSGLQGVGMPGPRG